MTRAFLVAAAVVASGLLAFLAGDVLRTEQHTLTFDKPTKDLGPLKAVNGSPFQIEEGVAVVTEPLAHLRVPPLGRTLIGKKLIVDTRFHLDEADVLEVGVKKTSFWLDYDRQPLAHRVLDELTTHDDRPWTALRSDDRVAHLPPGRPVPWGTLEAFEASPPPDGLIGLYGNAQLQPLKAELITAPFRVGDNPDTFRAIYAWYPTPDRSDPEWTRNAQTFDLARAYQNNDGSVDVMFFVQRRGDGPLRVLFDEIRVRLEPGWPSLKDLGQQVRRSVVRILRRPPPAF